MLSSRIPNQPRRYCTISIAQKFILEQKINSLPVDPFELAKKNNIPIISASEYARIMNCSFQHVLKDIIKSNDGTAKYINGHQFILYNEKVASKGRIKWTIMHELAHIQLGHLTDFKETQIQRTGLNDDQYKVLEDEADLFASQVLAPPIILEAFKINSAIRLKTLCGLSEKAAGYRYNDYLIRQKRRRFPSLLEIKIEMIFHDFIHKKRCVTCGHSFIIENAKYCPVCGKKRIYWGDGKMKYKDIEFSDYGKVKICLRCQNESVFLENKEFQYCKICGAHLVNKCAGQYEHDRDGEMYCTVTPCDDVIPDGNARFCVKCGSPTTFGLTGLLKPWEEELKELKKAKESLDHFLQKQVAATQDDD